MRGYDIVIIGGGINGCGIARDAAGRGLNVLLCEKGDLAASTSSASTKLIHGGLRYLEHWDFRLVRESLRERERLLRIAPHIIRPLRFILPHVSDMRPAWLIRLGLFLYDHLGGRRILAATRSVDLKKDAAGIPLVAELKNGYEYSDCQVDDARLVILNAIAAAQHGADIRIHTKCIAARRDNDRWHIDLATKNNAEDNIEDNTEDNTQDNNIETVSACVLINVTGVSAGKIRNAIWGDINDTARVDYSIRLVRGSHIVVAKMFPGERAYILQNHDKRIVFAIPYQEDYTLIGTTECEHDSDDGDDEDVQIDDEEIDYLLHAVNRYFQTPCTRKDIVWTYSGVRALFNDGTGILSADNLSAVTRDYVLLLERVGGNSILLNVFGGKITTYRKLAEDVLHRIKPFFPKMKRKWTTRVALPGGDFSAHDLDNIAQSLCATCDGLKHVTALRLVRGYGTRAREIIGHAANIQSLGIHFGADLYESEVAYMMDYEWARTAEDVLWRRSKIGLRVNDAQQKYLAEWIKQRHAINHGKTFSTAE